MGPLTPNDVGKIAQHNREGDGRIVGTDGEERHYRPDQRRLMRAEYLFLLSKPAREAHRRNVKQITAFLSWILYA